ncbi:MAG: type ISP restriction/modification enzyme [Dehalococcoidia bacterium]|jgi:predicted helicase
MSIQLIQQYHTKVEKIIRYGGSRNEGALRKPFQDLLEAYALSKNLQLVTEVEVRTRSGKRVVPDGTLKDALRQDWGYWESKDEKDDLTAEIDAKFAKGYPSFNILFEDTHTAVLYQSGNEVLRADFTDAKALDALLSRFVSYEPKEVTDFHRAIEQFNADVPALVAELRAIIEEQHKANADFRKALTDFLSLCQKAINPRVEMADVREMIIQHILTEDIFMTVFDDPQFHRENAVARKLQEVLDTFYYGATQHKIHGRIAPYYETINARAAQISNYWEKQKFLKALYENFYRVYNPKAADRLGVIYTPDEIVRFMIHAADHLTFKHFGKTLGDKDVEILDPAVGTGTFISELIEYLPENQLKYKYQTEIHCNEVAILPYYIANLNIEYTYKQKTGEYLPFDNICFVDTLDNLGFTYKDKQYKMFGLSDENMERIRRQNERKISVIIGNPPYNDNQRNENENNKNREYPEIDRRIKDTYINHSTAQKTHLYDMYTRFIRWASDRLDKNGVIAFVSNNSFLDARTYDGFRQVVAKEFNHIYVIDLKGNARTSGERRRREGGNVFSDQIRVGVSVYFLVRKQGEKGCRIHYNAVPDYAHAIEKKAYLRDNTFTKLKFEPIQPDKNHNWLNQAANDWGELLPIVPEDNDSPSIFRFISPGVKTNRDDWVYDYDKRALQSKIKFFIQNLNEQVKKTKQSRNVDSDNLDYSIKWSSSLKELLARGKPVAFDNSLFVQAMYRPFIRVFYYADKNLSDRLTANHFEMFGDNLSHENVVLCLDRSNRPFNVLAAALPADFHFNGDSHCFPLYRYTADGERVDNITDWALEQFQKQYKDGAITKENIFHYVYAVLHHPAYRAKYEINLKREFPHIPFYEDFRQWVAWGKQLMDLHLNYEKAKPYRLKREDTDVATPKTRLIAHKETGIIEVDTATTLCGVPPEAWEYKLGTYSALGWILERYKERKPKDPTICEKFNTYKFADYKEQVIDLLGRVCTVSVETMKIIGQMPD